MKTTSLLGSGAHNNESPHVAEEGAVAQKNVHSVALYHIMSPGHKNSNVWPVHEAIRTIVQRDSQDAHVVCVQDSMTESDTLPLSHESSCTEHHLQTQHLTVKLLFHYTSKRIYNLKTAPEEGRWHHYFLITWGKCQKSVSSSLNILISYKAEDTATQSLNMADSLTKSLSLQQLNRIIGSINVLGFKL